MSLHRQRPFDGAPDRYDGVIGLAALLVLGWAFLLAFQPLIGLFVVAVLVSTYAVARTGDYEHAAVIAVLAAVVYVSGLGLGSLYGLLLGMILAVVCYVGWRVITGRTAD